MIWCSNLEQYLQRGIRMNDLGKAAICLSAAVAIAVTWAFVRFSPVANAAQTTAEFVCYTDGKLTERHVGVKWVRGGGDYWRIRYVDTSEVHFYRQHVGETCGVEK